MSKDIDFEKNWLTKFSKGIDKFVGKEIRKEILRGSENFSDNSEREKVIEWSKTAMKKLNFYVDEENRINIMLGCACQYPRSQLQGIKNKYKETKSLELAHQMLQEQFETFLKDPSLELNEETIQKIIKKGWGSAGIRKGNKIIATKIPKSGYIKNYFNTSNPVEKRQIYCHCPRVRDSLKMPDLDIPEIYCYCGAGFYKGIWEEILQKPVKVKVLESVLRGGDVCKIEILLPIDN